MEFEVYCDESRPEVFTTPADKLPRFLLIGGLWLPADLRVEIKNRVRELRRCHNTFGEIKWDKVSPARLPFYEALVDLFEGFGLDLRFRCIAVEGDKVNWQLLDGDEELGFYKFYYQLLHHWILDFNSYRIFCDTKTNRDQNRLSVLRRCLANANLSAEIASIQALPSSEVVLIQLADFLLGMANARLNGTITPNGAKDQIVHRLESHLGIERLAPTYRDAEKFNIFKIRLEGGW